MTTPMASAPKQLETKWTPGPWHLKDGNATGFKTRSGQPAVYAPARDSDDYFILKIAELDSNVPEHEVAANARLIAASPIMAEALTKLCAILDAHRTYGGDWGAFEDPCELVSDLEKADIHEAITEALAKASGQ